LNHHLNNAVVAVRGKPITLVDTCRLDILAGLDYKFIN
jgi:hypothetical protein